MTRNDTGNKKTILQQDRINLIHLKMRSEHSQEWQQLDSLIGSKTFLFKKAFDYNLTWTYSIFFIFYI